MGVVSGHRSRARSRWLAGGTALILALGLFSAALALAPTIDPIGPVTVEEGETRQVDLNSFVADPDGDASIFEEDGLPAYGDFDPGTGVITFSPEKGDADPDPHTVTVTAHKEVGFNESPSGITELWSRQEGQTTGNRADRNRVLGGDQIVESTSVGQATATGSGEPTGRSTARSERNRNTFTVVLNPANGGSAPQFIGAMSNSDVGASDPLLTIQRPQGVEPGDFLLAHIRYRDHEVQNGGEDAPNLTAEGWEPLHTIAGPSQANHTVLWRFATAEEPNSYTFDENDPTGRMAGGIAAYRGVDPVTPIQAWAAAEPEAALVAPGVEFDSAPTVVVRLWGWHGYTASEPGVLPAFPRSPDLSTSTSFDVTVTESTTDPPPTSPTSTSTTTTTTTIPSSSDDPPTDDPSDPEVKAGTNHFTDDDGHLFEDDVNAIASEGITRGCNPPENTLFCPDDTVTRGQMAAFLVRALNYTDDGGGALFTDDDGHVFEGDIDRLAAAGVTRGCNPPVNDRFCPDEELTRGQMAAFLVRALNYTDDGGGDLFLDDDSSVFAGDIDRLATAGVTRGCNPPTNNRFCPDDELTRGQMAAFLARALIYGR